MVKALQSILLILLLLAPSAVLAKPATQAAGGKMEFEKAMRFYQAQEYEAALPWFEKAYELSGRRGSAIRALAQCERSLKRYDSAIKHFKEYLATDPTPSDAASVTETVRLLEEIVAEQARVSKPDPLVKEQKPKQELTLVPAPPEPPAPQPNSPLVLEATESSGPGPAPYVLVAGGGAALVAGTVLVILGASAASSVESAPMGTAFNDVRGDADAAPVLSGVGIALIGAGVVAAGGGLVWLLSE
jgi:hypothetical protein